MYERAILKTGSEFLFRSYSRFIVWRDGVADCERSRPTAIKWQRRTWRTASGKRRSAPLDGRRHFKWASITNLAGATFDILIATNNFIAGSQTFVNAGTLRRMTGP